MITLFTVEDTFVLPRGLALVGYAPNPDTRLPVNGELVEVRNPDGSSSSVRVTDVDVTFSQRSCFTQRTVNRSVLLDQDPALKVQRGAEVQGLAEGEDRA